MRKLRLRESERLFKGHTVEAGAPGEMGGLAPPWAPPRRPQKAVLPRAGRKAEAPPPPPPQHTRIGPPREAPLFPVIRGGPGGQITTKQETALLTASLQSPGVETEPRIFLPDQMGPWEGPLRVSS